MTVSGSTTEQTSPSQTFVIGGENINGTITQSSKAIKLYYFRTFASDGVSVTHNFIPVKNSSNVIGMYDTITGTFLTKSNNRTLSSENASDVQVVLDGYPNNYTYGVGATVYGVPTRAHSVFEGWCQNAALTVGCTTPYEITITDLGNKILHAKWSCDAGYHLSDDGQSCVGNQITIQYSKNGHGTESVPENQTCTYGSTVTLANGLTQQGWWFMGWSVAGNTFDGGETIVCNSENLGVTSGTVTLVADWEPWCNKITLDKHSNDASYGSIRYLYGKTGATDGKLYKNDACTVEYTSADYENVKPARTGWGFRGFYASSSDAADINATQTNGAARIITHTGAPTDTTGQNFINALTDNAILYAGWAQDCANSISNGTCSRTIAQNTSYTTTCSTGYHYDPAASESTYNPICVPNTITVILDKNGGNGTCGGVRGTAAGTMRCLYDGTCETPVWEESGQISECFMRNSPKLFAGWNTLADGTGTQYGTATVAADIQNINDGTSTTTLYAKWVDVTCNVENGTSPMVMVPYHNMPRCRVDCYDGYGISGLYFGTSHDPVVQTNQCHEATYDITYHENGGTRVLPDGFTLLEYVTADGNQYIDTGVKIKKSYEIRSKFKATELPKYLYAAVSSGNTASATAFVSSGSGAWRFGNKSLTKTLSLNTVYATIQNSGNLIINGTSSSYATVADFETPVTLALGAAHNADGTYGTAGFQGNIYEFRILDGNRNDVMNLVPMRRDSDGKVGLYDTVSGQFFTSIGSDDFVAGPALLETSPEGYTLIDSISSDGNQIIDTNIMGLNKRVVLDAKYTGTNTNEWKVPVSYKGTYSGTYVGVYNNTWGVQSGALIDGNAINNRKIITAVFDLNSGSGNRNRAKITIDGTTKTYTRSSSQGAVDDGTLKLFAGSMSTLGSNGFVGSIYGAKIYDKNTNELLFDGVPAIQNSDGKLGLYDMISGSFLENTGTGAFTGGDPLPMLYPREYLYSIGTMVYGVPVRAHSVFEGWCRNAALTEGCITPHEITASEYRDKDLYAKWSCVNGYHLSNDGQSCDGNDITIVYQKGTHGVGNPPSAVTRPYGSALTLADAMGDPQWTFTGWQINGVTYNAGDLITLDFDTLGVYSGNVNAVAQWEAEVYTVYYNCGTTWPNPQAPADSHPTTGQPFTAASASSCENPGYQFVGWLPESDWQSTIWVDGTLWNLVNSNDPNDTDVVFTAQWVRDTAPFTVTVMVPANTTFSFDTIASGQFWVDWDDGSNVDEFASTTVATHPWSHTYDDAGTYVIKIGGRASGYYTLQDGADPYLKSAISFFNGTLSSNTDVDATVTASGSEQYIVSVNGSLGSIFPTITAGSWGGQPRFYRTFKNTLAMTQLVQSLKNLFDGINGKPVPYMFAETFDGSAITGAVRTDLFHVSGAPQTSLFQSTFRNCTRLTGTIPAVLFANIAGNAAEYMFSRTFKGCTGLTGISAGLFSGVMGAPAKSMFSYTFNGCSNITGTLSSNLFGSLNGAPADYMFRATFYGCSHLSGEIPQNLFGNMTGAPKEGMFGYTFYGCSGLNGQIPNRLFGNITGAPASEMFRATFYECSGLTGVIPADLFANISGKPAENMFRSTFGKCSGLTGIGGALFSGINGSPMADNMFYYTFGGCSGLTGAIPDGLFGTPSGTAATYMFRDTFSGCSNLTGEIPSHLFGTPSGSATYMFRGTFRNCSGLTGTIPSTLFASLSGTGKTNMFYETFLGCSGLSGYVPEGLFGDLSSGGTNPMYHVFADSGLSTECPCGTTDISASSPFYSAWQSTSTSSNPKKVSCRVDTTPGDFYWYGGQCSTICPVTAMDELHVANLTPYPVLARKVTDVAINVKYGDTTCYVPLAAGNGGTNSLNMTYNNTVYHADRPGTTPPAGFGQR